MSERIGRDDDEGASVERQERDREQSREESGQRTGGRSFAGSSFAADEDEQRDTRDLGSRRTDESGEVF